MSYSSLDDLNSPDLAKLEFFDDARRLSSEWFQGQILPWMGSLVDPRPFIVSVRDRTREGKSFFIRMNESMEFSLSPAQAHRLFDLAGVAFDLREHSNESWLAEVFTRAAPKRVLGLDPLQVQRVLVTSEVATPGQQTGGIGSYVASVLSIDPHAIALTYGDSFRGQPVTTTTGGSTFPAEFLAYGKIGAAVPYADWPEMLLEAVLNAVLLFPNLRSIEIQEYGGSAFRIPQAKRALLLPPWVKVVCVAHGNHHYLDRAADDPRFHRSLELDVQERICCEESDLVRFPSDYLLELYVQELGYQMRKAERFVYPNDAEKLTQTDGLTDSSDVRGIVFLGKATREKGIDLFAIALERLSKRRPDLQDLSVKLFGVRKADWPEIAPWKIQHWSGGRSDLLQRIRKESGDSLFILPYRGDNQPLALTEVMLLGGLPIALNQGGVPEMFPSSASSLLCASDAESLSRCIEYVLEMPISHRHHLREELQAFALERSRQGNMAIRDGLDADDDEFDLPQPEFSCVDLVITTHNPKMRFLQAAVASAVSAGPWLNRIVIVDDGSDSPDAHSVIRKVARSDERIWTVLLAHNVGLPAARRAGLEACDSPYVAFLDDDDLLTHDMIWRAVRVLACDEEVAVVTSWSQYFSDDGFISGSYKPIGADIGMGLQRNVYGHAALVARRSVLLQAMDIAWQASRAKWEDWSLLGRIAILGGKITMVPRVQLKYRVREDSMQRTYSSVPGYLRQSWALQPLPRNMRWGVVRAVNLQSSEFRLPVSLSQLLRLSAVIFRGRRVRRAVRVLNVRGFFRELLRSG